MLQFPDIGSIVKVPLAPASVAGDPAFGVNLLVKLVGAEARSWIYRLEGIKQRDYRRIAELRRGLTTAEAPELFAQGIQTEDAYRERDEAERAVLAECLMGVDGPIMVGSRNLSDITDSKELISMLSGIGLLDVAAMRVIEAQSPDAAQLLSSGS